MDPATSFKGFGTRPGRQAALLRRRAGWVLSSRAGFRRFLISDGLGLFGSCFYQIILPGLVLETTGSPGAIAATILLAGIARISLMVPAGALSDAFSPKVLILISSVLRLGILIVLGGLVALGRMNAPALWGISLAFGVTEAIALPARGVLTRWLAQGGQLLQANSTAIGLEKMIGLAGPAAAGAIFAALSQSAGSRLPGWNAPAEVCAFAIQGLIGSASILLLLRVKATRPLPQGMQPGACTAPAGSLKAMVLLIFTQKSLRKPFLMALGISALSAAPVYIGLPILAASHFAGQAGILGYLMSAAGGGALLGAMLCGRLPHHPPPTLGRIFVLATGLLGAGLAVLFTTRSAGLAALALMAIGAATSLVNVFAVTHLQLETPPAQLGRMMGLLNLK
jgi:MFS family permease